MNGKILVTVIGLVAVACVPSVAIAAGICDPSGSACVGTDETSSYGPCPQAGQSYSGKDVVMVFSEHLFVYAAGATGHDCSGNSYNFIRAAACTQTGCAMVHWGTANNDECYVAVFAADGWQGTGCPIAPPDPGWGTLGLP